MANPEMSLEDAIFYLISNSMDMGDSLRDEAEYLAQTAGIEYDTTIETDSEILNKALTKLVSTRSSDLCEYLKHYFDDEYSVEQIFNAIVDSWELIEDSIIYMVVKIIYADIGAFPGGRVVQNAIQTNILDPLGAYDIDAAKVGKRIGRVYWMLVDRPEYGDVSNSADAVGHLVSDGTYSYQFSKDISNYYFQDRFPGQDCPWDVGFICKFRGEGRNVIADIFAFTRIDSQNTIVSNSPVCSIVISDFDDASISTATRQIADWYNTHVDDAIDFGIQNYNI